MHGMIRLISLLFLFFLLPGGVFSQMLKPEADLVRMLPYAFNPEYIRQQSIRSVTTESSVKEENQRIEQLGVVIRYDFDTSGYLSRETRISKDKVTGLTDTLVTTYYFNDQHLLYIKRIQSRKGYNAFYLDYDDTGNLVKKVYASETPVAGEIYKIDRQQIIWMESYVYERLSPNQVRKIVRNDADKPFMEGIIYSDDKGRVTEEDMRYLFTGIKHVITFGYDNNGRVTESSLFTNAAGKITERSFYIFDGNSNLTHENKYVNEIWKNDVYHFVNEKNGLLEAILDKHTDSKAIDMLKFTYEFYKPQP